MAVLLADTFAGSGLIGGTAPTTLGSFTGLTWESSNNKMIRSGGFAVVPNVIGPEFDGDTIQLNSALTSYSQPTDVVCTFVFRTGASVNTASTGYIGALIQLFPDNTTTCSAAIKGMYGGSWVLELTLYGGNFQSDVLDVTVAANTSYTGTITFTRGSRTAAVVFLGQTLTLTASSVGDANGFRGLSLYMGSGVSMDSLSVSDFVAPRQLPTTTAVGFGGKGTSRDIPVVFIAPTISASGSGSAIGTLVRTLPKPTLLASGTGATETAMLNYTLSMPTLSATGTINGSRGGGSMALPRPFVFAQGGSTTTGLVDIFPALTLQSFGGASARIAAPVATVSMSGTNTAVGVLSEAAPVLTLVATGTVSGSGSSIDVLPMPTMIGYSGAVLSVTTASSTLQATGTGGGTAGAVITLPMFDIVAAGTAQNVGRANLILPKLGMVNGGALWALAPTATLTAVGTAVVAVTYEAYALNLKHMQDGPDELTRYTNYPFDRIVRYKNSYFGMNSTGLYLLEGTTDFAEPTPTPITWSYKTAMTDFGSVQLKNISMAYFGGRMAPAATVTVYAGEKTPVAYAYTTPRDQTAQNYRQPLGKGLKARYYAIGAQGSGELSLDNLSINVAELARKV